MASADKPTETDHQSVEQALQPLVDELPAASVRKILSHVTVDDTPDYSAGQQLRLNAVKGFLITELNRRRPNRVQRLFMSLFEPVLITDPVLLRAPVPVYGAFQRVDLAALWQHVRRSALSDLAAETEAYLNAQIERILIDDLLRMNEALAHLEKLRAKAVAYLDQVRQKKTELARVIADINAIRSQTIAAKDPSLQRPAPIDRETLLQILAYLHRADALGVATGTLLSAWDEAATRALPVEDACAAIVGTLAATRAELEQAAGASQRALGLLPLVLVHQRHAWGIVPAWLGQARPAPEERAWLASALLGQMGGAGQSLKAALTAAFRLERPPSEGAAGAEPGARPLPAVSSESQEHLDALLDRALAAATAARSLSALEEVRDAIARHWRFLRQLLDRLLEVAVRPRLRHCMTHPLETVEADDQETLVWVAAWVLSWHRRLAAAQDATPETKGWAGEIGAAAGEGLRTVLLNEGQIPPVPAVRFLAQLDSLLGAVEARLSDQLSLASENLPALVDRRLREPEPLTPAERALVLAVLAMARTEVKASRNWKPRVASQLLDTAAAAGFGNGA